MRRKLKEALKKYLPLGIFLLSAFVIYRYWDEIAGIIGIFFSALFPFLLGLGISFVVNIPLSFFERKIYRRIDNFALKRLLSLVSAYLVMILIIVLVLVMIVPKAASSVIELINHLPDLMEELDNFLSARFDFPILETVLGNSSLNENIKNFLTEKGVGVVDYIISLTKETVSIVVTAVLSIIFSLYVLCSKERLMVSISLVLKTYAGDEKKEKLFSVLRVFSNVFHGFFVGQCTEAVILGSLAFLGMSILRLPYSAMISALIGVTALIPIVGAWIGGIVGFLLIMTSSPIQAVVFILFLIVLQFSENYLIYPKVVGSSIGLSGIWVLLGITVGGGVGGIFGMLLGVPIMASIFRLVENDMLNREPRGKEEAHNP